MIKEYKYVNIHTTDVKLTGENVIIWGRAKSALNVYKMLLERKANILGFTDSFARFTGEKFAGLKVFTMDEILDFNGIIYISTRNQNYLREIMNIVETLKKATIVCECDVWGCGIYDEKQMNKLISEDAEIIRYVRERLCDDMSVKTFDNLVKYRTNNDSNLIEEIYEKTHPQYFPDKQIFFPIENEVFVDAGAYDGMTSVDFAKWINGRYKKIYMMEPDDVMYYIAEENIRLENLEHVQLVKKGAYSHATKLNFKNDSASGSSRIDTSGINSIDTIAIDDMVKDDNVTYIKMDIEGAESEALDGGRKTIARCHPKLAISVYHKADDLWKIPYKLMEAYPFYKFYLRQYTPITTEAILYATE